jgi:hypothetical protein
MRLTDILLNAFEGSHPLVPKRKQSAYELERGPIYPDAGADKWTNILHGNKTYSSPQQPRKKTQIPSPLQITGDALDVGIRTDPSLEALFHALPADSSRQERDQNPRRRTLDFLNPT